MKALAITVIIPAKIVNRVLNLTLLSAFFIVLLAGCAQQETFTYGPPTGWVHDDTKWWIEGQDTTGLFRDLETLEAMEVTGATDVYISNTALTGGRNARKEFAKAVKRSLIRMYRNEPAVVDSLFEQFLAPQIEDVQFTNDPAKDIETFKKKSYRLLQRHFREPRTRLELGKDVLVVYPDSIREQGVAGSVRLQVYLDNEGNPKAVELIESVHPVLDQLALVATTEMRWLPAYVEKKRDWHPIPSWTRFLITFKTS